MQYQNVIHMLESAVDQPEEGFIFNQMNSFVITTEDGKLILVDGGQRTNAEYLLTYLKKLTGESHPHVDAWFLTHAHDDHVDAFLEVIQNHAGELTVDKVYMNIPSVQFLLNSDGPDKSAASTAEELFNALPLYADKLCISTEGDVYRIGEATIEILYSTTPDFRRNVCNNSSLVFKLTLGNKTALFLADAGIEVGNKLLEKYSGTNILDCDICQMAHHGQGGVSRELYEAVRPSVCLWCTPSWLWNNDMGRGYNTHIFQTIIVRSWLEEIGTVEKHYVTMDGIQVCPL